MRAFPRGLQGLTREAERGHYLGAAASRAEPLVVQPGGRLPGPANDPSPRELRSCLCPRPGHFPSVSLRGASVGSGNRLQRHRSGICLQRNNRIVPPGSVYGLGWEEALFQDHWSSRKLHSPWHASTDRWAGRRKGSPSRRALAPRH